MKSILCLCTLQACLLWSVQASQQLPPAELNQWTDWILDEHDDIRCLPLGAEAAKRQCNWPGQLQLDVNSAGATFTQNWQVYNKSWITLPGNQDHWPEDVLVNGNPFTVLEREGHPAVRLPSGEHRISGKFTWRQMPQYLQLAASTALIELAIAGERQSWPNLDARAKLYLQDSTADNAHTKRTNRVDVEVFRKIIDGVPVTMETILTLKTSGKPRELRLGRLLLANHAVTDISSPLPARIEDNGDLRLQVRAGNWTVRVDSRFTHNPQQLAMERNSADWPQQELWSFAAAPHIRGVKLEGAAAIDPAQLNLPDAWKQLPTYLIETNSQLILREQYRGDANPSDNEISNTRTVWLDFDGKGATVKDTLAGVMYQNWRLTAQPQVQLGRATVNGIPQLVTQMETDSAAGVDIRDPQFSLEAISRLPNRHVIAATGWQHDMTSLEMYLNLPPGWRLWHASGVDSVGYSWISRWDLWDLFICFVIIGSTFKLLGLPTALLALFTILLTYQENNAPVWTWILLILVVSLLRVLPSSFFRTLIKMLGYLVLSCLILISILFTIQQVRQGIYPQLEYTRTINAHRENDWSSTQNNQYPQQQEGSFKNNSLDEYAVQGKNDVIGKISRSQLPGSPSKVKKLQRYPHTIQTQTGPGEPTWQWQSARLRWSGPVTKDADLKLYLAPPWLTRLLMFVETGLLLALLWVFTREFYRRSRSPETRNPPPSTMRSGIPPTTAALFFIFGLAGSGGSELNAQSFPPEYLLQKWEARLLEQPDCAPHCLALSQVDITVVDNTLHLRMRADAGTRLALPIPTHSSWRITALTINGTASEYLMRDGTQQWLPLNQGVNDIALQAVINSDTLIIPFALTPHNVVVDTDTWEVFGLVDRRVPSKSLQFEKREKTAQHNSLLPASIKPFVKVERHILLELDWTLYTTVTRIAPQTGAIAVNIPLLEGESVVSDTSSIIEQNQQRLVAVSLAANQASVGWTSTLESVDRIELEGMDSPSFVEAWSVQASPLWHIDPSGLNPVKHDHHTSSLYRWLPWPGERVSIEIHRPQPVPGATTTVESVTLKTQLGARSTELEAVLQIHTSVGSDFRIEVPAGAELARLEIDNVEVPPQEAPNTLTFPLRPGRQTATVVWNMQQGVAVKTSTPSLSLSTAPSNIELSMTLPRSRWPLLVSGPDMGPAMLYWGMLLVMLLVAICFGYIVHRFQLKIPLKTRHWVLLMLGMSTVNIFGILPVIAWFFAMGARARSQHGRTRLRFNLMQIGLVGLSIVAAICLCVTIPQSLLSTPDMQVTGNGSHNYFYQWYQDNSGTGLPQGHVYSLPIWCYRVAMLAWSLWLAFALLSWARWSWHCFSRERIWFGKKDPPLLPDKGHPHFE